MFFINTIIFHLSFTQFTLTRGRPSLDADHGVVRGLPPALPVPPGAPPVRPRRAPDPGRLRLLPGVCAAERRALLRAQPLRHAPRPALRLLDRRTQEDGRLRR